MPCPVPRLSAVDCNYDNTLGMSTQVALRTPARRDWCCSRRQHWAVTAENWRDRIVMTTDGGRRILRPCDRLRTATLSLGAMGDLLFSPQPRLVNYLRGSVGMLSWAGFMSRSINRPGGGTLNQTKALLVGRETSTCWAAANGATGTPLPQRKSTRAGDARARHEKARGPAPARLLAFAYPGQPTVVEAIEDCSARLQDFDVAGK